MKHYRVLFQYFNPQAAGPHFGFTTVLAESPEDAATQLVSSRHLDQNLSVVQVVEANDFETGYTYADVKAQRSPLEVAAEHRREGVEQIVTLANAEAAGTLRGEFGTGWTDLVDGWMTDAILSLRAAGLLPEDDQS